MNLEQAKTLRTYVRRQLAPLPHTEGGTSPEEMMYLANLVALTDNRYIVEIGMNLGYSAHAFLSERLDVKVVSFDLCTHEYIDKAKALIDEMYPGRHILLRGDSTIMVPKFANMFPVDKFDMAFIDGGHSYRVALADLYNVRPLVKDEGTVVMDDVTPYRSYGRGPTKAWNEAKADGLIQELEIVQDGIVVEEPTQSGTHVWATGYYKK